MTVVNVAEEVRSLRITALGMRFEHVSTAHRDGIDAIVAEAVDGVVEDDPIARLVLDGYRQAHVAVGAGRKELASPAALRRMVLKHGRIPRIHPVVDLYNAVSLRTGVAFGAHDEAAIEGDVQLRLADGGETFTPLGTDKRIAPNPGEYVYVDDSNDVLCRLEVRQGERTKVTAGTQRCLVIAQGNPALNAAVVRSAAAELAGLMARCCGATLLDRDEG
ncbi:MAG TPA: phenylalanine--tRNA ligase beta subunit-related protein [Solirubrobacteraceae bacterium]|jgi:DNA/RNA-binding domain of Phe-tRNA-synthetase-like protein